MICIRATLHDKDAVRCEGRGAYPHKTVSRKDEGLTIGANPGSESQLFRLQVPFDLLELVSQEENDRAFSRCDLFWRQAEAGGKKFDLPVITQRLTRCATAGGDLLVE